MGVYECHICFTKLTTRTTFISHLKLHAKRPIRCLTCQAVFNDNIELQQHMKTVHLAGENHGKDIEQRQEDREIGCIGKDIALDGKTVQLGNNQTDKQRCGDVAQPSFENGDISKAESNKADKKLVLKTIDIVEMQDYTGHDSKDSVNVDPIVILNPGKTAEIGVLQNSDNNPKVPELDKESNFGNNNSRTNKSKGAICDICGLKVAHKRNLKAHKQIHFNKPYHCKVCSKNFTSVELFETHKLTHIINKKYRCKYCRKTFKCEKTREAHIRVHEKKMGKGKTTLAEPVNKENVGETLPVGTQKGCKINSGDIHSVKASQDLKVEQSVNQSEPVSNHLSEISNSLGKSKSIDNLPSGNQGLIKLKPNSCELCGVEFSLKRNLKIHKMKKICQHKPNGNRKSSSHVSIPRSTKKASSAKTRFSCNLCPAVFLYSAGLYRHKQHKHMANPRKFTCDVCDSKFLTKHNLERHSKIHGTKTEKEQSLHSCKICSASFISKMALGGHVKIHNIKIKPNISTFKQGEPLERETTTKVSVPASATMCKPDERFSCSICDAQFTMYTNLQRHQKIHDAKPHHCKVCRKNFSSLHMYENHIKAHGNKLKNKSPVKYKESTHHISRNLLLRSPGVGCRLQTSKLRLCIYKCKICSRTFHDKIVYYRHLTSAHGVKSVAAFVLQRCKLCNKTFKNKSGYHSHLRKLHGAMDFPAGRLDAKLAKAAPAKSESISKAPLEKDAKFVGHCESSTVSDLDLDNAVANTDKGDSDLAKSFHLGSNRTESKYKTVHFETTTLQVRLLMCSICCELFDLPYQLVEHSVQIHGIPIVGITRKRVNHTKRKRLPSWVEESGENELKKRKISDTYTYKCPACSVMLEGSANFVSHIKSHVEQENGWGAL